LVDFKKTSFLIYLSLIVLYGFLSPDVKEVCIKNTCIRVVVASTELERQKGLMFRHSLPEDEGMLFVFEEEKIHAFWMKNMQFPLDIIWIDAAKRIVDIYKNALPCQDTCEALTPQVPARFVLEVNAGFVEENKIKAGDILDF
jgi:uncharacterized membrane protein (UPF0127 family)